MRCALCGYEFTEDEGKAACAGCPLGHGCAMRRCPNCGYEMPAEPEWLRRVQAWRKRGVERKR
jgi:rubredoxin